MSDKDHDDDYFLSDEISDTPCAKCGGEVREFSVPSHVWNRIVRRGGPEQTGEYLCVRCFNKTVTLFVEDYTRLAAERDALQAELAAATSRAVAAEAIVAKLPKYADTGQPFVPSVDPCFVLDIESPSWEMKPYNLPPVMWGREWSVSGTEGRITRFYSAEQAALAALASSSGTKPD